MVSRSFYLCQCWSYLGHLKPLLGDVVLLQQGCQLLPNDLHLGDFCVEEAQQPIHDDDDELLGIEGITLDGDSSRITGLQCHSLGLQILQVLQFLDPVHQLLHLGEDELILLQELLHGLLLHLLIEALLEEVGRHILLE